MKKKITSILIMLLSVSVLKSQEVHFSQFFAAPLYLSPAMAGTTQGTRIAFNFRDQWPKFHNTFISTAFSIDHNFRNMNSGLGLLAVADRAGAGSLGVLNVGLVYSYNIQISENWHIRPGINFQYGSTNINMNELYSINNINSNGTHSGFADEPFEYAKFFDFSASAIVYNRLYWGGFTLDHLFKPNEALLTLGSESRLPIKFSVFGGGRLVMREDMHSKQEESLSGVFLFRKQSNNTQFDIGAYWTRTPIVVGLYYRGIPFGKQLKGSDALVFMGGYKIADLTVGYSYDYTISSLAGVAGGAHEISVVYLFNKVQRQKKKKWAPVPCPAF